MYSYNFQPTNVTVPNYGMGIGFGMGSQAEQDRRKKIGYLSGQYELEKSAYDIEALRKSGEDLQRKRIFDKYLDQARSKVLGQMGINVTEYGGRPNTGYIPRQTSYQAGQSWMHQLKR